VSDIDENLCPHCKGKCCWDECGYRIEHMAAEFYEHVCDACLDGNKYVPARTAEQERAAVLDYLAYRIEMSHYADAIKEFINARHEISEGVHLTLNYDEVLP
jgi:hypothetical protein